MARKANLPCPCGSGKSYKKCHRDSDRGLDHVTQKLLAGELPFSASVSSENGESCSMHIENVTVSDGFSERVLLDERITLETNSVSGDTTSKSKSSISLPMDGSNGSISSAGNASVKNSTNNHQLSLSGSVKKMKAKSSSGGFAVAMVRKQHDTGIDYFDFLFGVKGQSEVVGDDGRKSRSHIAVHPDGNGKFLRLHGNGCQISTEQSYNMGRKAVIPKSIQIATEQFLEKLLVEFSESESGVVLNSMSFVSDEINA